MIDRIKELINTLEQDYQANDEGKTYVNGAQATLYELQKQIAELKQGLEQGKNFSLLGEGPINV